MKPSSLWLAALFTLMVTAWSLSFVVVKFVTPEIPSLTTASLRAVFAGLLMIPIAFWDARRRSRDYRWSWESGAKFALAGTTGITLNQLCFISGVSRTSIAHAAIVLALGPVLVHVLAVFAGQEHATIGKFLGMAIALVGVAWLQVSRGGGLATPLGDLIMFAGALSFAVYTVVSKQLTSQFGGVYVTAICFVVGAITMLPFAITGASSAALGQVSLRAWSGLAYMVVIQSITGYLIFYYLLTYVAASRVSMFCYIQPILAILFGWMILHEPVTWTLVGGGAAVFAGVWLAERHG